MSQPKECRSCGATIFFATNTKTGKVSPYDADGSTEVQKGFRFSKGDKGKLLATYVDRARDGYTGPLHQSHFATCPRAARYRSGG